jgi:hypothetical protein
VAAGLDVADDTLLGYGGPWNAGQAEVLGARLRDVLTAQTEID